MCRAGESGVALRLPQQSKCAPNDAQSTNCIDERKRNVYGGNEMSRHEATDPDGLDTLRAHAPYFAHVSDKTITEWFAAKQFLEALFPDDDQNFDCNPNDPPDVIWVDTFGQSHGIEVSELVDSEMLKLLDHGQNPDWHDYSIEELRVLVLDRLHKKEKKRFNEPPSYASRRLILFSDEPDIAYSHGESDFSEIRRPAMSQFDEVWIMLPPEPNGDACRLIKIEKE